MTALARKPPPAPVANVSRVHLVYMTHLDLGYTGTTRAVCSKYFDEFFPAAFDTSQVRRRFQGSRPPHTHACLIIDQTFHMHRHTHIGTRFPPPARFPLPGVLCVPDGRSCGGAAARRDFAGLSFRG